MLHLYFVFITMSLGGILIISRADSAVVVKNTVMCGGNPAVSGTWPVKVLTTFDYPAMVTATQCRCTVKSNVTTGTLNVGLLIRRKDLMDNCRTYFSVVHPRGSYDVCPTDRRLSDVYPAPLTVPLHLNDGLDSQVIITLVNPLLELINAKIIVATDPESLFSLTCVDLLGIVWTDGSGNINDHDDIGGGLIAGIVVLIFIITVVVLTIVKRLLDGAKKTIRRCTVRQQSMPARRASAADRRAADPDRPSSTATSTDWPVSGEYRLGNSFGSSHAPLLATTTTDDSLDDPPDDELDGYYERAARGRIFTRHSGAKPVQSESEYSYDGWDKSLSMSGHGCLWPLRPAQNVSDNSFDVSLRDKDQDLRENVCGSLPPDSNRVLPVGKTKLRAAVNNNNCTTSRYGRTDDDNVEKQNPYHHYPSTTYAGNSRPNSVNRVSRPGSVTRGNSRPISRASRPESLPLSEPLVDYSTSPKSTRTPPTHHADCPAHTDQTSYLAARSLSGGIPWLLPSVVLVSSSEASRLNSTPGAEESAQSADSQHSRNYHFSESEI